MARVASGAVTVFDILDGASSVSIIASNDNHSFVADQNGLVAAGTRDAFKCIFTVYYGTTIIPFEAAGTTNNTYKLGTITYDQSNTNWTLTGGSGTDNSVLKGHVVLTTVATGTSVLQAGVIATVPIIVKTSVATYTIPVTVSLSKAIIGATGAAVWLTANRQTFTYNSAGTTSDSPVVLTVESMGSTGTLATTFNTDGGSYSSLTHSAAPSAVGQATFSTGTNVPINGTTITIPAAAFGNQKTMNIKVAGTNGADILTIARISDGAVGPASLFVKVESNDNFAFRNNTGANKTLTATVLDMSTGTTIGSGITYTWYKDGVVLAGQTTASITVAAGDVPDNGAATYTCSVSVT